MGTCWATGSWAAGAWAIGSWADVSADELPGYVIPYEGRISRHEADNDFLRLLSLVIPKILK